MSEKCEEKLKIRPYARLLTMLGEQLIKNERIALVELIKNAYDADADNAFIIFENFGEFLEILPESKIIIEDNGEGMTLDVIKNSWMNPATSIKYAEDVANPKKTKHGRVVQGEKGIGRFATLKIGRKIEIITRPEGGDLEYIIDFDLSCYDDEFLKKNGKSDTIYLDEIDISLLPRVPEVFVEGNNISRINWSEPRKNNGTRIEISDLKGKWTENKLDNVLIDISKLNPIFSEITEFPVEIIVNNKLRKSSKDSKKELLDLVENSSVFKITEGHYDDINHEYRFKLNGEQRILNFDDTEITALRDFKGRFSVENNIPRYPNCGPFKFSFYIFDLTKDALASHHLNDHEKKLVKSHRVYLYRDNIRVFPYGDPDDDWLQTDKTRGTWKAGDFLSNDQTVGCVEISKSNNPHLKDKTNREGLIEQDESTDVFIGAIRILLAYIRKKPYEQYKINLKDKKAHDIFRTEQLTQNFDEIKDQLRKNNDNKTLALVSKAETVYKTERKYLTERAEKTEDLASIGLSVEVASHDISLLMGKVLKSLDDQILLVMHDDFNREVFLEELNKIKGMTSFINSQLSDIQLLFRSSKRRRKNIKVKDMLDKVVNIYRRSLKKEKIELIIEEKGSPLIAKTSDAILLQLFLNLIDNAVFWLSLIEKKNKMIIITLDGNQGMLIFSDNGPGIDDDDRPYIFEAFYSGKGEEGKGLGLYIARQLLERNDYSIELADTKSENVLEGANFVVSFVAEGER